MQASTKLWFRAKSYGYGWVPASWQGWSVLGLYILCVISLSVFFTVSTLTIWQFVALVLSFASQTAFLLVICVLTGEKAKWRWGK